MLYDSAGSAETSLEMEDEELPAPRTYGAKKRGFAYCRDTEAVVPVLAKGLSYSEVAGTVAPPKEFVHHHKIINDATALTALEKENPYSRKVAAVVPLSDIEVSFCKNAPIAAPPSYFESKDAATQREFSPYCQKFIEAVVPTSDKEVSYCKIKETVPPNLEKGGSYCEIKAARTPTSDRGAFYSTVNKEADGPTLEKEVYVNLIAETAATASGSNGVSHFKTKEAAVPKEALGNAITETAALTLTNGPSHCKANEEVVPTSEKDVFRNEITEAAAPTSDNGVSYYEMGFPDVLCPPSPLKPMNDGFQVSLYVYIIQYSVLQEGQDHINVTPPTQFVLLNYFSLSDEVAHHFSVRLNLPHQECVLAHLIPFDMVCLTSHQVNIVEVFNGLLFSFMLGKNIVDFENFHTAENKTKGYLIMPLKDGVDSRSKAKVATRLIDWTTAFDLVHSKLNIKKWMHYHATPIPDMNDWFPKGNEAIVKGCLRLKSGSYKEEDLVDAFVTYGPWNLRCFIVGISKELSGLSLMQGNDCCLSYKDYWLKRFGVELKYASQPILIGYSLSHVGNFLLRPSQEAFWCNAKARRVLVPPEVCILQTGLKGNLWRGAFRLPSILGSLENALLAAQLRDSIGPQISVFKVQEALTSGAYNVYQSYERLELVGDSFLTLVAATALYMKDSLMNKSDLASSLHSLVENKHLFQCAEACGLAPYVFNEPFRVKQWIPPGRVPECLDSHGRKSQIGLSRKQRISWRTLADVVEAIVGAYAMDGSLADVLKAMSWLRVTIQYPRAATGVPFSGSAAAEGNLHPRCWIANVESHLKYSFKNHDLLSTALCYHSREDDGGLQFSRLAYLGDCILSHHVARHLITMHHSLDVGIINEMKQSIINKESLACAAVRNKLHMFITSITPAHEESIIAYVSRLEKESMSDKVLPAYGFIGLCAPKGLGDLISSIAAAVYLDCELDSELAWKIFQPFLEPLPVPGSFSLHPINELTQYCKARHLLLDVHSTFHSGVYKTCVIVNEESIASFEHEDKRYARKYAAVKALHQLKSREMKS